MSVSMNENAITSFGEQLEKNISSYQLMLCGAGVARGCLDKHPRERVVQRLRAGSAVVRCAKSYWSANSARENSLKTRLDVRVQPEQVGRVVSILDVDESPLVLAVGIVSPILVRVAQEGVVTVAGVFEMRFHR